MNVLLATSAAPQQSPFSTGEKRPPIGLGFLIAVLRDAGHQVFFIDNYLRPNNFLETDYLQKNAIDLVGLGDSLSEGVQSADCSFLTQPHTFLNLVGRQMGAAFSLPIGIYTHAILTPRRLSP